VVPLNLPQKTGEVNTKKTYKEKKWQLITHIPQNLPQQPLIRC
jgi:hypothetical protein